MNKLFTKITSLALGAAMMIGVGVAVSSKNVSVANATDQSYTFTSKSWADSTSSWTSVKDASQMNGSAVQVTTGYTNAGAQTKSEFSGVSKVVLSYHTNGSSGAGSVTVKIGSNTAQSAVSLTKTGGTTTRSATVNISPAQSGVVKFTVACSTNSIYVDGITITYDGGGGGGGGATGITSYTDITAGDYNIVYRLNNSDTDYYMTTSIDSNTRFSSSTTAADAGVFTFESAGTNQWYVSYDSTGTKTYIKPHSSDNAKNVTSTSSTGMAMTAQAGTNGNIRLGVGSRYMQRNAQAGSNYIGSYNGGQRDIFQLIPVSSSYTVTFDLQGHGSAIDSQTIDSGGKVTKPTDPTATGYTFGGWYKESACTNAWNFSTDTVSANTILYAKWTGNSYNINYYDQGGSTFSGTHASGYPTSHTYGVATTLKTATKTGYDFGGWFTTSACTGSAVTSLGATSYTAAINLYAKWTIKTFTVTYNKNTSDTVDNMPSNGTGINYNTVYTLSTATPAPERTGYSFDGWSTTSGDDNIGGKVTSLTVTSNVTVYAIWTQTASFHDVTMNVSGYSLTGTTHAIEGAEIDDLYIVPGDRLDYPTSITITGTGVTSEDWDYNASNGLIYIYNLKSDMSITFTPVDAERELCVTPNVTEFSVGDDFDSTGIRVYWLYEDQSLTEDDISAGGEHGYTIDSSAYKKNRAGTYTIYISCEGESANYQVTVVAAPSYQELFTVTSDEVVSNSGYDEYTGTYHGESWIVTCGGNNKSLGSNKNNIGKAKLSNYSKYAVSPVTTSVTAVAFASTTSIDDVGKIVYQYGAQSGAASSKVYLLYSSNDVTYSQITLSSGTQGATLGDASTDVVFEFSKCSGYFALVFAETDTKSDTWRIDDVSITFYESVTVSTDPACSITSTFNYLKLVGDDTHSITAEIVNPEEEVVYTISYSSSNTNVATIDSDTGALVAVGVGETTITVSADHDAESAQLTLYVLSTHSGLTQNDALTSAEALNFAAHLDSSDLEVEYYVTGVLTEVTTAADDQQVEYPDYIFDNSDLDLWGPTFAEGCSDTQMVVGRTVTFKGTLEGDSEDYYAEGEVVYIAMPTLNSISFDNSCDMTMKSYSSKSSYWKTAGLVVYANYQGESALDVTSEVEWSFSVGSPSAVPFSSEEDIENYSLTVTASFGGKTASKVITGISISFDGYQIHTFDGGWQLVTDASSLSVGDELVIGCSSAGKTAGPISNQIMSSLDSTFGTGEITSLDPSSTILTLGGSSGAWTLSNEEDQALGATAVKKLAWGSGTTTWDITISNDGNATIQSTTDSYGRFLCNNTANQERFTTYTSSVSASMLLPQLYRKSGIHDVENDLIGAIDTFYSSENFTCDTSKAFDVDSWNTYTVFTTVQQGASQTMLEKYELNKIVANENGNKVEQFLAMYDYVIGFKKAGGYAGYSTASDFLGRYSSGGIHANEKIAPNSNAVMLATISATSTAIIIVISMIGLSAVGGFFFLRKRKEI